MTAHFVNLLEDLRRRISRMAGLVEDMVLEACESVDQADPRLAQRVIGRDKDVDAEEVEIELEVIRLLALYQPVGSDLRLLCAILKINNDLERIADCAVNVAERARHLGANADRSHRDRLLRMGGAVRKLLRQAIQAFIVEDMDEAKKSFIGDDAIDAFYLETIKQIVAEPASASDILASQLDILAVAKNLERIADHATNIAEDVVFMATGEIVRHGTGNTEAD